MNNNSFHTISSESHGDYRERGSKFFSFAYPILSIDDVKLLILNLRKEHPKSTHVCSAFILRDKNELTEKPNDDGEPSGSAGMPILNAIKSQNVQNVLVCVVRYYGGTKLGVSGLINAYRSSAKLALEEADIVEIFPSNNYMITFDYDRMGVLMALLKDADLTITSKTFEAQPKIEITIRTSIADDIIYQLKRKILGLPSDYKVEIKSVPGITINRIDD